MGFTNNQPQRVGRFLIIKGKKEEERNLRVIQGGLITSIDSEFIPKVLSLTFNCSDIISEPGLIKDRDCMIKELFLILCADPCSSRFLFLSRCHCWLTYYLQSMVVHNTILISFLCSSSGGCSSQRSYKLQMGSGTHISLTFLSFFTLLLLWSSTPECL